MIKLGNYYYTKEEIEADSVLSALYSQLGHYKMYWIRLEGEGGASEADCTNYCLNDALGRHLLN